jgi:membrane fusion protein, multidrug efflux system
MKKGLSFVLIIGTALMAACVPSELEQKKADLKKYKQEVSNLNKKIRDLEQEIAAMDPEFARVTRQATLITSMPVQKGRFEHFLEVSGTISSRKNVTISAETAGKVLNQHVREGDFVQQGQMLIRLDDEIIRSNVRELETQLSLARTVYERWANLWKQNIGSEIQYLEAKNTVEALESRLAAVKSQLGHANIRAPFSGSIDRVFVRVGETAQPGLPLLRLVSMEDMYIEADFSEAFIGRFNQGSEVEVMLPSQDTTLASRITAVGNVVNRDNRTFSVEVTIPKTNFLIKPNQIAVVRIKDFEADDAVIIPTNLIQMDNVGDYVYVVDKSDSLAVARKAPIKRGITFKGRTMVSAGLNGNEILINQGFRQVADGHIVREVEPTTLLN